MQNYANHTRWVPLFHFITGPLLIANAGYAIFALRHGLSTGSILFATTALALLFTGFFSRFFALKAQDRVIRLEMRLRLRDVLPASQQGDILRLSTSQLIALRFACDAELPGLVTAALKDNLGGQAIKKQIQTWVPDHDRV
jgi:hypothetical protein